MNAPPGNDERRVNGPPGRRSALGGGSESAPESLGDGYSIAARVVFDLVAAPRAEIDAYLLGRVDGYLEGEDVGYTRGWQACDDEISALQRAAYRVVQAAARLEPHAERVAGIQRRQVDAAQRHDENARPWAQEAS